MKLLYVNIVYNVQTDEFTFESNMKPEHRAEVLADFLRAQIGGGKDNAPPIERQEYHVRLTLDLTDDTFRVTHDCGNLGLRDGLLLHAMERLK